MKECASQERDIWESSAGDWGVGAQHSSFPRRQRSDDNELKKKRKKKHMFTIRGPDGIRRQRVQPFSPSAQPHLVTRERTLVTPAKVFGHAFASYRILRQQGEGKVASVGSWLTYAVVGSPRGVGREAGGVLWYSLLNNSVTFVFAVTLRSYAKAKTVSDENQQISSSQSTRSSFLLLSRESSFLFLFFFLLRCAGVVLF